MKYVVPRSHQLPGAGDLGLPRGTLRAGSPFTDSDGFRGLAIPGTAPGKFPFKNLFVVAWGPHGTGVYELMFVNLPVRLRELSAKSRHRFSQLQLIT